jgi:hypothetical protein
MGKRICRASLATAVLVAVVALSACRVIDGGGQQGQSAPPSDPALSSQDAASTDPTDVPAETPQATPGADYPY